MTENQKTGLLGFAEATFKDVEKAVDSYEPELNVLEFGTISYINQSIAGVKGLPDIESMELVRLPENKLAIAFNLEERELAAVLLDQIGTIAAGDQVQRTRRVLDVPVGEGLLGRIVDSLGRPLDGLGAVRSSEVWPIERRAPAIMDRAPVTVPLQTGIQVVDSLIPIGQGQRELVLGDRQTGKTAIAVDAIVNQRDKDVLCIYCAIGKQASSVAEVISDLKNQNAFENCIVVAATGSDLPGMNYMAPYAATTMAEYFMAEGKNVLIVYDDLTRHARSYRELSLLLRRPPAREAYPGDIFYIHSRLLERSTHLRDEFGGGSLTALPIIETEAQNISAYIPTNLISITDGQIYLSPKLFQEGVLPAVDVGKSVSRVGGKAQLPVYRGVAGDLRLSYSQFEELEAFSRFGTKMDEQTRKALERGRRVREVLKQPRYKPIPVGEQIAVLLAVNQGVFDGLSLDKISEAKIAVRKAVAERLPELAEKIQSGEQLSEQQQESITEAANEAVRSITEQSQDEVTGNS
jgi:F-type H+-transporting ATPase subunit alpha